MSDAWGAYAAFHASMLDSRDVDPAYPVLSTLAAPMTRDQAAWLAVLHLTYYHLGSALAAWADTGGEPGIPSQTFPCSTERRGNRATAALAANLRSWLEAFDAAGGPDAYLRPAEPGVAGYGSLTDRVLAIHGNGRWAAYKATELMMHMLQYPVDVPDMGHAHSTGPRKGLADLDPSTSRITGHTPAAVRELDRASALVVSRLRRDGLPAPVEQVETTLCDWHSTTKGRYYVGHDVDSMMEALAAVECDLTADAWQARERTLPAAYLGELNGWWGVDRARCRIYRETGLVAVRATGPLLARLNGRRRA